MARRPTIIKAMQSMSRSRSAQPVQVYDLKITLRRSKPPIWRRVAVPSDMRLGDLHEVIQIVMGWTNSHLHQFVIRDPRPKPMPEELRALGQIGQLDALAIRLRRDRYLSDPRFGLEESGNEKKVMLSEVAPAVKSKFIYEYDFGDGWEHLIEVVKIGPPAEGVKYPMCIGGKGACPPEDCGGIWGYYEMLEAVKDPKHERHGEFIEWLRPDFDPERFDLEKVNVTLGRVW